MCVCVCVATSMFLTINTSLCGGRKGQSPRTGYTIHWDGRDTGRPEESRIWRGVAPELWPGEPRDWPGTHRGLENPDSPIRKGTGRQSRKNKAAHPTHAAMSRNW